jgi:hypothetical protein
MRDLLDLLERRAGILGEQSAAGAPPTTSVVLRSIDITASFVSD